MNEVEAYIITLKQSRDNLELHASQLTAKCSQLQAENEELKKALWERDVPSSPEETKVPAAPSV